ncbi:DUF4124 domain-containing protein [Marinobacter koreensis]|jgi:predicted RNase H-like nuclease (RuvC/YqgF family)|uniref:DUF4124 domain-containing protein n=1 Tax=Marinobacter koreensis TaxID=335974 RepID=A0ABW0RQS1_9GAMM|nr:DUF4124 domain-containing protein [Marinobacter koreensis]MCK7549058.1 DUF4124 domain-containing protein [Marinobacter koreensis]MDX1818538.1 DUF4124 domain-containing protein [Marinobacter sp.]
MSHRLSVYSSAALLAVCLGTTLTAHAQMYRYTDDNGQVVIGNTIPQEATKRGYDILGSNGRVVETVPPAPTKEEIAAREAEKQREQEREQQRKEDEKLLKRYSHPDQAVKAMYRKIREMQGLIQLKRGNIAVVSSQLDNEQSRAADMERSGRDIPDATLQKIERLESQIKDMEREIASQQKEILEMKESYLKDIKRLEEITDEERTLPLDPPKEN